MLRFFRIPPFQLYPSWIVPVKGAQTHTMKRETFSKGYTVYHIRARIFIARTIEDFRKCRMPRYSFVDEASRLVSGNVQIR
jgi:hypothetical protein